MCVCVCRVNAGTLGSQKVASDLLELELEMVVGCQMWMLNPLLDQHILLTVDHLCSSQ